MTATKSKTAIAMTMTTSKTVKMEIETHQLFHCVFWDRFPTLSSDLHTQEAEKVAFEKEGGTITSGHCGENERLSLEKVQTE